MIYRLTYCNKKGVEARIDIIKGDRTSVEIVKGSANPFTLSYKLDKTDKSGHIMTSSADIEIFETEEFNIDKLKTSNETELKVEYFENNILTWSGFILPDFFSREIGSPNIVRMTASDRLTALKGITLSDLPTKVSLRDLIELCLEQTGLDLALVAQIQINQGSTNILDSEVLSQRLTDVRGRSINCYDILMSIMVGTNSTIRQRAGQWQVYNKLEHELRTPTIFFDKVEKGAIRTIQPVASSVGVYNEFGGSKIYPENYNFAGGSSGWTVNNAEEMEARFDNLDIKGFDVLVEAGGYQPVYGTEANNPHMVIYGFRGPLNYVRSANIPIPAGYQNEVEVKFEINASAPIWNFGSHQRMAVYAVKDTKTLVLQSGQFVDISTTTESQYIHRIDFKQGVVIAGQNARVSTQSYSVSGKLTDLGEGGLTGYTIHIRLFSSDRAYATVINLASINFTPVGDAPKGNLYKTTQGSNFTKLHDIETTIFGDYITTGLNGYFYNYPIDDTSNLYLPSGPLSPPQWITPFDTTGRPLLHHISRQKSRLFSVAHDILRANINVESFDPLAVFQDCKGGKYVVVSASFDFLRSEVDVELEQIAEDDKILKRDFIYSYFGEGESNIKSIGGIAGGGGGGTGGGGMTYEQLEMLTNLADWWKLDEENDAIYSEKSVYSLKGVSALGYGDGGGSGGGVDMLDSWANYTSAKANYYVPASLLVPFRSDTLDRLTSLESGSATSIETTGSGNAITSLTKSGSVITADKGLTFALASHTHTIAQITGLQGALDLKVSQADIDNTFLKLTGGTLTGTLTTADINIAYNKRIGISYSGTDSTVYNYFYGGSVLNLRVGEWTGGAVNAFNIETKDGNKALSVTNITGNVGIGTTNPLYKLEVVGTGRFTGNVTAPTFIGALSGNASSATTSNRLNRLGDNRNSFKPSQITGGSLITTFSTQGALANQVNNYDYSDVIAINSYVDSSTGKVNALSFDKSSYRINHFMGAFGASSWDGFKTIAYLTDNVASATKLQTARTIWGQSFDGTGNVSGALTGATTGNFSVSVSTPKVDFGNGFTIEPSGTELVFKYDGVIKQRMLSDGTILATGGVTALATS